MIKFFRLIRQRLLTENKFSKYLLYAIGEILLVVIGILIALQINNKNEAHKVDIKQRAILVNFIQDLKSDYILYSRNLKTLTDINKLHKKLYEIGHNNANNISIQNPNFIRLLLYYNPIAKENDPFIASKISNNVIRKEILNYFRYMNDMDVTYGEFKDVIQKRMRLFLAKKEVHNLPGWFNKQEMGTTEDIINRQGLISLSKTSEFQQLLLEASIKSTESLITLEELIKQNKKIIATIDKELNN